MPNKFQKKLKLVFGIGIDFDGGIKFGIDNFFF